MQLNLHVARFAILFLTAAKYTGGETMWCLVWESSPVMDFFFLL